MSFETFIGKLTDVVFIKNANNCWHFNINEHNKFHAQFSQENDFFFQDEAHMIFVLSNIFIV